MQRHRTLKVLLSLSMSFGLLLLLNAESGPAAEPLPGGGVAAEAAGELTQPYETVSRQMYAPTAAESFAQVMRQGFR